MSIFQEVNHLNWEQILSAVGLKCDRSHKICCPFHREKTPSLHLYEGNGGFFCFGCNRSGDKVKFLAEVQGVSNGEAASRLSGVRPIKRIVKQTQTQVESVHWLRHFYNNSQPLEGEYLKYWNSRGFTREFGESNGIRGAIWYSVPRILIPDFYTGADGNQRLGNLCGRAIVPVTERKYVFVKNRQDTTYRFATRRDFSGTVTIVEGWIDALAGLSMGLDCVAIGGSNYRVVGRLQSDNWQIVPDNDPAGQVICEKIKSIGLSIGKQITIRKVTTGKDLCDEMNV